MSDTKVFEFTPNEACETGAAVAGGVQKVLDDYTASKTVESITSYTIREQLICRSRHLMRVSDMDLQQLRRLEKQGWRKTEESMVKTDERDKLKGVVKRQNMKTRAISETS